MWDIKTCAIVIPACHFFQYYLNHVGYKETAALYKDSYKKSIIWTMWDIKENIKKQRVLFEKVLSEPCGI